MGKAVYLNVSDKKVLATKITYNDLIILYKQYIDKYGSVPMLTQCLSKYNLPQSGIVKSVVKNEGISYNEFLLQFGKVRTLNVNGIHKNISDLKYDDLVILYNQYINKFHEFPTTNKCTYQYNLPSRQTILKILKDCQISVDEFNKQFSIKDKRHIYEDIHIGDIIGRWKIIAKGQSKQSKKNKNIPYWICQCTCGSEIIKEVGENALKRKQSLSCGCLRNEAVANLKGTIRSQSFYDWCIEQNHEEWLKRWDYNLNNLDPKQISYCAHKQVYFKCDKGIHNSTKYELAHVSHMDTIRCKYCNSFAQKLIDEKGESALELYWDYDKNKQDPWEIPAYSKEHVWIKCTKTDYHGSYKVSRQDALRNECPYCSHIRIHQKDSFAQWMIDKYGKNNFEKIWNYDMNKINPFTIAPSTRTSKVWLNCIDTTYHPPTHVYPNDVKNHEHHCSYCAKKSVCKEDSLGYKYPESFEYWSDKNNKTPYEYLPYSNQKVWWKCKNDIHKDYIRSICDTVNYEFRCPKCSYEKSISFLQEKVDTYITDKYVYNMLHEHNCNIVPINPKTNFPLPFDNEIVELKLIIEVHGKQHYEITGFTQLTAKHYNTTPKYELKYQKWKDKYKKEYALKNGYYFLEIPYWTEIDNTYQSLIDSKIKKILKEAV